MTKGRVGRVGRFGNSQKVTCAPLGMNLIHWYPTLPFLQGRVKVESGKF